MSTQEMLQESINDLAILVERLFPGQSFSCEAGEPTISRGTILARAQSEGYIFQTSSRKAQLDNQLKLRTTPKESAP